MIRRLLGRIPLVRTALPDIVRLVTRPKVELAVWRDYWTFRRATAFLRSVRSPAGAPERHALLISMSDAVYHVKLEAMLAVALKREGYTPVALLRDRLASRPRRYFRAMGIRHFVYMDDYQPSKDARRAIAAQTTDLLAESLTFQSVKRLHVDGARVGVQALSSLSRSTHQGTPDPADPSTRAMLRELLGLVLERQAIARSLLASVRPQIAVTFEANYALYGPFVDESLAAGVDVIQAVQPWRDDALTFKRLNRSTRRMHPGSVAPETLARLVMREWSMSDEARLWTLMEERYAGRWKLQTRNQTGTRPVERHEVMERYKLDPRKPVVTVFSHILWDANLFYGEDLFDDFGDWFVQTIRAARDNDQVNWLIKLHPANVWKRARDGETGEFSELTLIRRHVGDLPSHVILLLPDTDISTLSLFRMTDFGVTVRGTSGMELPCFGVPTFTAGTGRYSGLGFTRDSQSREEYLTRLSELPSAAPMTEAEIIRAKRHALAAFADRQWAMRSFRPEFHTDSSEGDPLDHNLAVVARSMREIAANGDLDSFGKWAVQSRSADYLCS